MHKTASLVGCLCVCVIALAGKAIVERKNLSAKRATPPVTEESAKYESHSLKKFSLGFDNVIADLLWVRLLQNASHEPFTTPGVSWEYAQLNAITALDRNYNNAYEFGSAFLSVFRRDKVGAKNILKKWTENFPTKWKAHYILGFHLYYEMGENKLAAEEMLKAAGLPNSPPWLHALGVRLMSEDGALLPALQIALNLYSSILDEEGKARLGQRIRSLRYQLQKKQWENALASYRAEKKREPASFADLRDYFHPVRELAQIEEESQGHEELHDLLAERFRYDYRDAKIVGLLSTQDSALEVSGTYRN